MQTTATITPAPLATSFAAWYVEAARAALFLRPRWQRLEATPATLAVLTLCALLLSIALDRVAAGAASLFDWRALGQGWLGTMLTAWACYLARPERDSNARIASGPAALIGVAIALSQVTALVASLAYYGMQYAGLYDSVRLGKYGVWVLWLLPLAWAMAAEIALLMRSSSESTGTRLLAGGVLLASSLLYLSLPQPQFWYTPRTGNDAERPTLALTQELMEAQPALLARRLDEWPQQRPGVTDLYAITFAPYSDEDVFRNESAMVGEVMRERFGAHTLQLVNHVDTTGEWPWATRLNLRRAIAAAAARMDRDKDILFLHLTSHGARDGVLAAEFWPMSIDGVTPADLKAWLDEAGVRYRILSISACYSGSWIALLAGENTLVMTAADADHTSYGCGRGSELTFFGRAMYNEQLREHTLSFEQAHATARELIRQREEEAGKSDGYSNPQISVGSGIRRQLETLQTQAAAQPR